MIFSYLEADDLTRIDLPGKRKIEFALAHNLYTLKYNFIYFLIFEIRVLSD